MADEPERLVENFYDPVKQNKGVHEVTTDECNRAAMTDEMSAQPPHPSRRPGALLSVNLLAGGLISLARGL